MVQRKKKKKRQLVSLVLAGALVLSGFGFAGPTSAAYKPGDLEAKVRQLKQLEQQETLSAVQDLQSVKTKANLKATDKVRVIVEVEGQTPVEYATKQGKLYKQLSESKKNSLESDVLSQQKTVKSQFQSKGINIKYKEQFSTVFNGFSGEVFFGDIAKIESISGVKNVYIANEYKRPEAVPEDATSHNFIQSRETWQETGYKGEGMVVSIIDTGIDPTHRDFILTDKSKEDLSKDKVGQLVKDNNLKGKFYTDKVPYGYNYFDENDTIIDIGATGQHGMHVAGIVSANGDEANGGVKGVAPESQVLAMKVFSNDPNFGSTWSDVYLVAIDDSIKLGADALNMSLGDVASFYEEDAAEDLAIQRAVENGVVCAVAAGNSGHIGYGLTNGTPLAQNPDIGTVGAPSVNPDAISVAASNNGTLLFKHSLTLEGTTSFKSDGYGADDWTKLVEANGGKLELVSLGGKLGYPEDYNGVDVKGKVVVVPRGDVTFVDKTKNAYDAGAAGIIVYNNDSAIQNNLGNMQIPFMMIAKTDGAALEAAIAAGNKTLKVTSDVVQTSTVGKIATFSSWGTTPSLELKPEITAPGGSINSTLNDNKYGTKSGTSMATPHVAGGSALVQEYLKSDKRFSGLSVAEHTKLAKILLMNTAKVINDVNGHPYSPRLEGAGMMQTLSAVTTPVYVVNKANGEAKVELKAFQKKQFEMTFTAKSISDKDVTYKVNTTVLTDAFKQQAKAGAPDLNALMTGDLQGAKVDAPETVTVPAGKSVDFTVKVDFTDAKIPGFDKDGKSISYDLKEDIFVEGSVNLTASDNKAPNLTVPYVGFYGKWDRPQIIDGFKSLGETNYYDLTAIKKFGKDAQNMLTNNGKFLAPVPEKNFYPLNPNKQGELDEIDVFPTFLRNAKEVQFNILDKDGNFLRRMSAESDVAKSAYDGGNGDAASLNPDRTWDGKVKGQVVKDGLYYYEIKAVIDYKGAQWQSKKIPVYVDTTAPKVTAIFDPEKGAVSWSTVEEGTGVKQYGVFVDGVLATTVDGNTNFYKFATVPKKAVVEIVAQDYAANYGSDTAAIGDVSMPKIYLDDFTPEPYAGYNTHEIPLKGYVTEDLGLKSLKVNGTVVPTTKDAKGNYAFQTSVKFDQDGLVNIIVEATDHANKTFSIARKIFLDTEKPVINVTAPERVDKNVDEVTVTVNLQDNYNYLKFYVDENQEFETPFISPVDYLQPHNKDYKITLPLVEGENKFVFRAVDYAGNETTKEVIIQSKDDPKPPVVSGVKDNAYYNKDVTVTFDKGTATLNGEAFTSGTVVKEEGTYTLIVTSEDGIVTTVHFTIDKTAPVVSGVKDNAYYNKDVTISFDKGTATLNGKDFTSGTVVKAEGTYTLVVTSEAGNVTTVKFTIDKTAPVVSGVKNNAYYNKDVSVTFDKGTATLNGKAFTSGTTVKEEGSYTLIVTSEAGNKTTVKFTIDKTAPVVVGVKNNAYYNKDVMIAFDKGTASLNGKAITFGTIVKAEGSYTLIVTSEAGNKTTVKFTIDKTAPNAPTVKEVSDKSTTVTGKAEANAVVKLYIAGKLTQTVTADKSGNYSFTIKKQNAGTQIKVTATDKAGNVSKATTVKVVDKTPPAKPSVDKVTSKSTYVSGKAEKGATVYVYNGKKLLGKGTVNSKGAYKIKIKAQKKGTTLTVYAVDKAKNKSKTASVKVK